MLTLKVRPKETVFIGATASLTVKSARGGVAFTTLHREGKPDKEICLTAKQKIELPKIDGERVDVCYSPNQFTVIRFNFFAPKHVKIWHERNGAVKCAAEAS